MIEAISDRQAIASQIRQMRAVEQSGNYRKIDWSRDMLDYLYWFNGLSNIFKFTKELDRGNLILDIGAGTTQGISEIAKSKLGQGLNFEATTLSLKPEIKLNLGLDKTHITPVESLKGIENDSVSLVLALNSVAYSAAPLIAVQRIDEVLVPGGVIKATFKLKKDRYDDYAVGEYNYQTHDYFTYHLRNLNYDVFIADLDYKDLIIAIKPGSKKNISARDLLKRDSGIIDIGMVHEGHY